MPYSIDVTYLDTVGEPATPKAGRLWMLWSVIGTGNQQSEEGRMDATLAGYPNPTTFSFARDGNFTYASRSAGFSVQDANRVAEDRGWLFRSGRFEDLPTDPIEIVNANVEILPADLPGMLPSLPMTVDAQTTITALTASIVASDSSGPGGIDFVATGTTTKTGVVVGLTYSGRIVIEPSADVAAAETEALSVGIANPLLVFSPGPSVLSAIEAELLNLLRVFIMREAGPQIRTGLERRINASVIASAGRSLPGGTLPAGVTLSIRTVTVGTPPGATAPQISVRAAVGAFGGVFSKLPPPPSGGGGGICAGSTLVALGMSAAALVPLRELRDLTLAASVAGRERIDAYYRFGGEVSALMLAHPELARRTIDATEELARAVEVGAPLSRRLVERCEQALRDLANVASPELRTAIAAELRSGFVAPGRTA